jgi:hypothetical protein
LVYLVDLVHLISLVQLNKPNNGLFLPAAPVCGIEEWGATAESEAQWRHPFEASEIFDDHTYPN